MNNKQLAALFAAVVAIGAVVGALYGVLHLADLMDRVEQELGQ